jgi:hypothetical protein
VSLWVSLRHGAAASVGAAVNPIESAGRMSIIPAGVLAGGRGVAALDQRS